jgi:hypothetical protein
MFVVQKSVQRAKKYRRPTYRRRNASKEARRKKRAYRRFTAVRLSQGRWDELVPPGTMLHTSRDII